jgi:hypothetical protein
MFLGHVKAGLAQYPAEDKGVSVHFSLPPTITIIPPTDVFCH